MQILGANYSGYFNDKRLEKRGKELSRNLFKESTSVIQRLSGSRAEQKGYYRFLNNEGVTEGQLISEMAARCGHNAAGRLVLCIQDTSEVNLISHSNRLQPNTGLGLLDADHISKGYGFKFHPGLVVDACTYCPIGWSDMILWNRSMESKSLSRPAMQRTPIEEKESYKWIRSANNSQAALKQAAGVILIQDREADIYELFAQVPDDRTFLLVRSRCDRNLQDGGMLWNFIGNQPVAGHYTTQISADSRSKQPAREALLEVRYGVTEIRKPGNVKSDQKSVRVCIVEAREINSPASKPVEWRIITTLAVNSFMDACQVLDWYSCRWMIEEAFRVLKKERFDIEASELERGWAIRKLTVMMLDTIISLFQMQYAYSIEEGADIPATYCFTPEQIQCMAIILPQWEGKTEKQKNPFKPQTLAWACWIIARLGGWKGYSSQRPPGLTTWSLGLQKFFNIMQAFSMIKDVGTP